MGGAASAVSGLVGGVLGGVGGMAGSAVGSAISPILQDIAGIIPAIPIADQSGVQNQINAASGQAGISQNLQQGVLNQANTTLGQANGQLSAANSQVNTANQVAQGGDVANSLQLLQQQANGTAPSAAQAVLQSAKNQAISQQQAMANSGNVSQMVSGQKTAMDNAAQLTQQAANQATQLQATQQQTGQQNYASAAAQQAAQLGTNAGVSANLANTQTGLYGTQLNASNALGSQAGQNIGTALTGQTNALGIQQGALSQTGQNLATAIGGGLSAIGTAASSISDENTKTDISYASGDSAGSPMQSVGDSYVDSATGQSAGLPMPGLGGTTGAAPSAMGGESENAPETQTNPFNWGAMAGKLLGGMSGNIQGGQVQKWQILPLSSDANQKYDITQESQDDSSSQAGGAGAAIKKGFLEGSGYTMSDKKTKKDIGPDKNDKVAKFLDAIDAVSYKYKNPDGTMGKTPGEHIGVIAQQVEKAPGGKSMIVNTPQGKAIDLASAVGTLMAAAAETHDRIKDLEALFQSKRKPNSKNMSKEKK